MNKVLLAAISSGSGKTTITCGLIKNLKNRGLSVKSYKSGPDYIDPMFHKKVLGIPSENLDLFFANEEHINSILYRNKDFDISVIEGAMGIYDGILGLDKNGSAYDLARKTNTPIILIVDAKGIGSTIISVIKGILLDDEEKLVKGVIFNRMSSNLYLSIKPTFESQTGIKALGYVPKLTDISIDSRHLGLKLPEEIKELDHHVETISDQISKTVDVDEIMAIASEMADCYDENITCSLSGNEKPNENVPDNKLRLAVALDEAFCFYYEDNFRVLREQGIELCFFSPIHDTSLPNNISGIILGGGYPELKLNELEANISMKQSIKKALDSDIPSLAECGGFMYLHEGIELEDRYYELVGAVDGKCFNTGKLCRFGYVDVSVPRHDNKTAYTIKAHEFHYFDSTNNGSDVVATKPGNGKQWELGFVGKGKLWGFPHLYYSSCKEFIIDFVLAMEDYRVNIRSQS